MTTTTGAVQTAALDASEVLRLALDLCFWGDEQVDDPGWVTAAREAGAELPAALRRPLRAFRRDPGDAGTLLLRGLPIDAESLPPTPTVDGSVQRMVTVPAAVLMMIACELGEPTAFRAEKTGALVQDVVPVPGKETFQGNAGSVLLTFHNENAFHRHRPDYVLLLCLRPDHDRIAGLRTVCVREVLPLLTPDTRAALASPEFLTAPPPSFGGDGASVPHAVLHGAADDPDLRVDLAATTPLTPRAEVALGELGRAFEQATRTVRLTPGDLAIVDNRVTVHGRTDFTPRYDGEDRWLQRTFVTADFRRSRDHRPHDGHVLEG
ncbi:MULTISPECIES: TauD/TfdA family dioxygenase [Actinokineospora]|uniref:L-asparagine oxygenase n=1 Tax=Actinokineospora fastidiosa TaxID=1816 RepID=A0A918GKW6_9PSEU|nr:MULTISPECIES: TauD/TfdA family dioxygenase [Actinokineospora]UVS77641.1 L-asparagine oxygenase [Actinokineospora sp. UTMC 2448]GGS42018.1 L-asparagine oxygenase [Actinokineospora fastidiosa]